MAINRKNTRAKIKRRIKKKIQGTTERPRLTLYRSNNEVYAQIVDDIKGVTLCAYSSLHHLKDEKLSGKEQAQAVGKGIAEKAISSGVEKVVFDRSGYLYHGRVKALAEGAREGGLKF